ncbi:hypothetical protein [Nocardia aobensis]|uniref:hypothetical protein n=1 Tax=Nocardia aobensis TaxID=257277 RepID=UPI0002F3C84A|nr:hypothetical protein [Nocardia aobensis]
MSTSSTASDRRRGPRLFENGPRLFDASRALEFWDAEQWQPRVVARRCWRRLTSTRRRRWITWSAIVAVVFLVVPMVVGAVATAAVETETEGPGGNSALGWTKVRDSHGVSLADYVYATNHGGILHPGNTGLAIVLGLLFAFFMVLVTLPTWMVGWVLDFGWLNVFSAPLNGVAHALSGQLATPIMLATFASIGALIAAYFLQRGFHAKAVVQVLTMLVVAVIGPVYLSDPLGEVLSSHGLLAEGRNVGLSVSAGLNGNSNPDPSAMVPTLQEDMADNFARRPLQVWNFGHVVDDRPGCAAAWSAGVRSGSEGKIKDGMKSCGDQAAARAADNPSFGQIGAGLLLLITATILLIFAAYLSLKIIWSALDSVYWGIMTIFGFAGGGLVYGPTQTFTVRAVVHGMMSAVRMCVQIIALGVYLLFFGDLFRQAKGQEMSVFVIGAIVMIVGFLQFKRLTASLDSGNEWVANRFALAIQNPGRGGGGGGGGGGHALGMGEMGAHHKLGSGTMMAVMAGASTISNSPLTEWLLGALPGGFHPQSRMKKLMAEAQAGAWVDEKRFGGSRGWYVQSMAKWEALSREARKGARAYGGSRGIESVRGMAGAIQGVLDADGGIADSHGAMLGAGLKNDRLGHIVGRSRKIIADNASSESVADKDLSLLVAALRRTQNSARLLVNGKGDAVETAADFANLEQASRTFRRIKRGGVALDGGAASGVERDFVNDYMLNPTKEKMVALQAVIDGDDLGAGALATNRAAQHLQSVGIDGTTRLSRERAARMSQWIGNEHAKLIQKSTEHLMEDVTDADRIRDLRTLVFDAVNTDHWASGAQGTPWNSVAPKGQNNANPNWQSRMAEVARYLQP